MYDRFYRSLYKIRRVEEEIVKVYPTNKIKSPIHLSIGQESVSVGVCQSLLPEDVVFGTYRSHAFYLAKGGNLNKMIAELYGKETGGSKGKGGSMHLIDVDHGVMGASAVVGTTIPQAVGYAYAAYVQRKNIVVVCFFGDGATDEGVFFESLNFAALKSLPVIFICENNGYAIHTHQLRRQRHSNICERARTFGMSAERLGDDVLQIFERVDAAAQSLRSGQPGPFFFECATYRWKEHVGPDEDFHLAYRTYEEAKPWVENDQVKRIAQLLDPKERQRIECDVDREVHAAFAFAEESSFPDPSKLFTHVFKGD